MDIFQGVGLIIHLAASAIMNLRWFRKMMFSYKGEMITVVMKDMKFTSYLWRKGSIKERELHAPTREAGKIVWVPSVVVPSTYMGKQRKIIDP